MKELMATFLRESILAINNAVRMISWVNSKYILSLNEMYDNVGVREIMKIKLRKENVTTKKDDGFALQYHLSHHLKCRARTVVAKRCPDMIDQQERHRI